MNITSININGLDQETHKISTENFNSIEIETNTFDFLLTSKGTLRDFRAVDILVGRRLQQFKTQNIDIDVPSLR